MLRYQYLHPDTTCPDSGAVIEEVREVADRSRPAKCPDCGVDCKKIISSGVSFNPVFAGSTRHEFQVDEAVRMSDEAQQEGFKSRDELDTAIGLAEERAKQMGTDRKLIGPVDSPFESKYKPTAKEIDEGKRMVEKMGKAIASGDQKKAIDIKNELKGHEQSIHKKMEATKTFKPKATKEDLSKRVKASQSSRPGYV